MRSHAAALPWTVTSPADLPLSQVASPAAQRRMKSRVVASVRAGCLRRSPVDRQRLAVNGQRVQVVADPPLVALPQGEIGRHRVGEVIHPGQALPGVREQLIEAPLPEHGHGRPELAAARGQRILNALPDRPGDPLDQPVALQAAQPVAQHVGTDPRQKAAQLAIAARGVQKLHAEPFAPAGRRFRQWAAIPESMARIWEAALDEALAFAEAYPRTRP